MPSAIAGSFGGAELNMSYRTQYAYTSPYPQDIETDWCEVPIYLDIEGFENEYPVYDQY